MVFTEGGMFEYLYTYIPICFVFIHTHKSKSSTYITPQIHYITNFKECSLAYGKVLRSSIILYFYIASDIYIYYW